MMHPWHHSNEHWCKLIARFTAFLLISTTSLSPAVQSIGIVGLTEKHIVIFYANDLCKSLQTEYHLE